MEYNDKTVAYALLRIAVGVNFAGHGFVRPDDRARAYEAVAGFFRRHLSED